MADRKRIVALVVGGGRGTRFGPSPKQYEVLEGQSVFRRSIAPFLTRDDVVAVIPVIGAGMERAFADAVPPHDRLAPAVVGGADRQASVLAGLRAAKAFRPSHALVHDAARPFVTPALVDRVVALAGEGAVPSLPVTDTLKRVDGDGIAETVDRSTLRAVQTPQGFPFDALLEAHGAASPGLTDDAAVMEAAGHSVRWVEGEAANVKITHPTDMDRARMALTASLTDIRTAQGYDVHAFGPGDHVWLCGVKIPHTQALTGHSDADVGLHALTDAVLAALAEGDIGQHFPPSEAKWKGVRSDRFLAFAVRRVSERGGAIRFADVTLVCEHPKIGPQREAMRTAVAAILGIALDRVSVKATTSERLGFTGREEGIAALACATVALPDGSVEGAAR